MKKLIFVILLASSLLLSGCYDIGFGHNNNKHHGGDSSQTYELQADGSWKGTEDGSTLSGTDGAYIAELDKAPASGGQPSNVKSISNNYEYTNTSGTAKMVIIRTTGGNLTINAPLDTVLHYGEAGTVNVIAVASSSYDGYAAITQKLVAKAGHIKLFDLIAAAIPLIEVPADATGAVAIDIPADVVVGEVTVASDQATSVNIAGEVTTVTVTGSATTTTTVDISGIVDSVDGVDATVSGEGYVDNNNGGGSAGTPPYEVEGTIYKVKTALGLKVIAGEVNGGETFAGKTVQLQNDIDLAKYDNWTPIGTESNPFGGSFDGKGFAIKNLKNSLDTADFTFGFFGCVGGNNVEIKNVSFADVAISLSGGKNVGAAVGYALSGNYNLAITNITVSGNIIGKTHVGGVIGKIYTNYAATISGCTNNANVTQSGSGQHAAGIVGVISLSSGTGNENVIESCTNNGTITAKVGVAGIVCYMNPSMGEKNLLILRKNASNGNLVATDIKGNQPSSENYDHFGFISECVAASQLYGDDGSLLAVKFDDTGANANTVSPNAIVTCGGTSLLAGTGTRHGLMAHNGGYFEVSQGTIDYIIYGTSNRTIGHTITAESGNTGIVEISRIIPSVPTGQPGETNGWIYINAVGKGTAKVTYSVSDDKQATHAVTVKVTD